MDGNERINNTVEAQENSEERTFTQEEVNEIIRKRLSREKEKTENSSSGADKEKELADRELRLMPRERLFDVGMPSSLADVLRYTDEESLDKAIEEIKKLSEDVPNTEKRKTWGQRQNGVKSKADPYREAMGLK